MTIFVVGPTNVGKSAVCVNLAKRIDGEIISADSMQIYRELNIGTAKITKEEMQGIPHHLIDILSITQKFSAAQFAHAANEKITDIKNRGKTPIVCGGTGLYINSLLYDLDFSTPPDYDLRDQLEKECAELGVLAMHKKLKAVSESDALRINENDKKRILRRLEVVMSGYDKEYDFRNKKNTDAKVFGLNMQREKLYDRINSRVTDMINNGLIDEATALYGKHANIQAIGYTEIFEALRQGDNLDIEKIAEKIRQNTRRYAKRQLTWFLRDKEIFWINVLDYPCIDNICDVIINNINV